MRKRRRNRVYIGITLIIFALTVTAVAVALHAVCYVNEAEVKAMPLEITPSPSPKQTKTPETLREKLGLTDDDMKYLVLVNFENEFNYEHLELVPNRSVFDTDLCTFHERQCNPVAGEALNDFFREGIHAGYGKFIVNSAYRDRREQSEIWESALEKNPEYGKNPYDNPVRAMPPGMSEHETGLAFDVLTEEHPFANKWFGTFEDGIWLKENCAKYGFILRYPEDKTEVTGVMYEPWHFRYVGKKAALYMQENNMCLEEFISALNSSS